MRGKHFIALAATLQSFGLDGPLDRRVYDERGLSQRRKGAYLSKYKRLAKAIAQRGHAARALSLQSLLLLCIFFSLLLSTYPLIMGIAYSVGEVDHLYTFFVQWSPDIYNKNLEKPLYLMVNNDKPSAIDSLLQVTAPSAKNWEIVTENEPKYCHSMCGLENEEEPVYPEKLLPDLLDHSHLLDDHHIESLANHMPVRTQGYPWRMVYSTAVHGTSLNTLYREMADVDSPVLLVIKDMEHNVFGAFSSDPFRVSNYCYGTGETFLYSFSPQFQAYRWSGENCYFVRGHLDALQIGGGGGRFGLWLDSDLYQGSSFACSTFQNQPLSSKQDFKVHALEVWTVQ